MLTSRFGTRDGEPHEGVDIAAVEGTDILAAESGVVVFSGRLSGYGKTILLRHDGNLHTLYAHCQRIFANRGDRVRRGETIARVGQSGRATAPHLHFEVRRGEIPRNPFDYLESEP